MIKAALKWIVFAFTILKTSSLLWIVITSAATNAVVFQTWEAALDGATASTDVANAGTDLDFHFIVCGKRGK